MDVTGSGVQFKEINIKLSASTTDAKTPTLIAECREWRKEQEIKASTPRGQVSPFVHLAEHGQPDMGEQRKIDCG